LVATQMAPATTASTKIITKIVFIKIKFNLKLIFLNISSVYSSNINI